MEGMHRARSGEGAELPYPPDATFPNVHVLTHQDTLWTQACSFSGGFEM